MPTQLEGVYSTATKKKETFLSTTKFASFPAVLCIQVKRFVIGDDWTPRKNNASMQMPLSLDLESLRSRGLIEGETLLPPEEKQAQEQQPEVEPDMAIVTQLMSMGFSENGCKRAVIATKNVNADVTCKLPRNQISRSKNCHCLVGCYELDLCTHGRS